MANKINSGRGFATGIPGFKKPDRDPQQPYALVARIQQKYGL